MNNIFIDGLVGTTGLQIHSRLKDRRDVNIIEIEAKYRKNLSARKDMINSADVVILCLPDQAARESVSLISSPNVRVLDASSAHRVTDGWTYGLPELSQNQSTLIESASRVSNPGCYPTGAILLLKPLIEAKLLDANYPYAVNAVSGYTGGGREAIARFEDPNHKSHISSQVRRYALHDEHKHIKEIHKYCNLVNKPVFTPMYGNYRQGIILQIPIQLNRCSSRANAEHLRQELREHYHDSQFISVGSYSSIIDVDGLEPDIHNNSNKVTLHVLAPKNTDHVVLTAIYDNLGKGASGAAVQNLEIMLGLDPSDGSVAPLT
ncbi:N-acetyl-gamma-glutamyl-phosphate reductase [Aliivibrio sifiae]|uniref:N-acetyl-gamma-glutamyl-phosphate reductase n=1 Tax=Aliivibrio sifiae TaxID=566293 RepID=UPI003D137E54